eukprot:366081-Chlamydomonas_euryale.AAC.3
MRLPYPVPSGSVLDVKQPLALCKDVEHDHREQQQRRSRGMRGVPAANRRRAATPVEDHTRDRYADHARQSTCGGGGGGWQGRAEEQGWGIRGKLLELQRRPPQAECLRGGWGGRKGGIAGQGRARGANR